MIRKELARYIGLKRSLGFQFRCQHGLLKGFVAFAAERGDRYVKTARVLEWAALAPSPAQRRRRLLTLRRFALAIHAENARHQVPAGDALGSADFRRRSPYIYSAKEIARLIGAASALEPAGTIRSVMYATLIGLIASTGMRISEALALQVDDITADGLLVRKTKFRRAACFRCMRRHGGRSIGTSQFATSSVWLISRSSHQSPGSLCPPELCTASSNNSSSARGVRVRTRGATHASTTCVTPLRSDHWSGADMMLVRLRGTSWR